MRVNVYAEELTDRIDLVEKTVEDPDGETTTFYGLRLWLKFPTSPWWVHRKYGTGEPDDDSSAVTIWGPDKEFLKLLVEAMGHAVDNGAAVPGADGKFYSLLEVLHAKRYS